MKKMRKIMGILLAAVMVICMSAAVVPAEIATTYKITIKDAEAGHTYEAYRIFKGRLEGDILSDIDWGDGVTIGNDGFQFADKSTAPEIAAALTPDNAGAFAKAIAVKLNSTNAKASGDYDSTNKKYEITGLNPGYYLVKDKIESSYDDDNEGKDIAYTAYILEVVKNVEVSPKTDKPTVEKKVKENVKTVMGNDYGDKYNDVADYNIGDKVPFKLIGRIPDMTHYSEYKYVFHDTLSNGLTLDQNNINVFISANKSATSGTNLSEGTSGVYQLTVSNDHSFTITFNDLKKVSGANKDSYIIVTYEATLNKDAVIGLDGNTNKVYLEYSNNPNDSGSTGKTPEDQVIVFTYKLDVTKVDGSNKETKLQGAEFKLKNSSGKWLKINESDGSHEWKDNDTDGTIFASDSNGTFSIPGLDDGTYYLKETKAPAGYNTPSGDGFKIQIIATTVNNQEWNGTLGNALTKLEIKVNDASTVTAGTTTTGVVSATIENNKGATLPSTGGMGTKIFYTLGAVAVLYAGVKLITRRRMRNMQ